MSSIFGTPLIVITKDIMPAWQQSIKRIIDVLAAIVVLIAFSPFYLMTAIVVVSTSKGPASVINRWCPGNSNL